MKICKIEKCGRVCFARSYCKKHYHKFLYLGKFKNKRIRIIGSPIHRIISRVITNKKTGCWEFQGYLNHKGYARTTINYESTYVHRYMYEYYNEIKLRSGECVCHSCDNPRCVNPKHLWLGTVQDNINDRDMKGRHKPACGSRNAKSKISDELRMQIKKEFETGKIRKIDLVRKYDVSYDIVNHTIASKHF